MRTVAHPFLVTLTLLILASSGCGRGGQDRKVGALALRSPGVVAGEDRPAPKEKNDPPAGARQEKAGPGAGDAALDRKIRYTADMALIVEDFAVAEKALRDAVKGYKGFIAKSELSAAQGKISLGTWRVRVPVPQFEAFRDAMVKLGDIERNTVDSEDMTEEFYDLTAHIKNRKAEEEAVRQMLEKHEKAWEKLENILALRRELASIRDDINRKEGRLRVVANLTELTTVNVTIRQRRPYEPPPAPAVAETPTFGRRISRTFSTSLETLSDVGQAIVVAGAWLVPWLPFIVIASFGVRWGVKWIARYAAKRRSIRPSAAPTVTLMDEKSVVNTNAEQTKPGE